MTTQYNDPPVTLPPNNSVHKWSHFKAEIDKVRYLWILDNFSYYEAKGEVLRTPIFTSSTNEECKWYLSLNLNSWPSERNAGSGISDDTNNSFSLFVYMDRESTCRKIFLKYEFSILNSAGEKRNIKKTGIKPTLPGTGRGLSSFVTKNQLLDDNLLQDDRLSILCEAEFSSADLRIIASECKLNAVQPNIDEFSVSKDLEVLLTNELFTDVTLSVNGQDYPAHKIILAARSPVFAAMFRQNMKESDSNRVEITDIDAKVMKELLHYIYTGKSENLEEFAEQLFVAAEKYDLKGLKVICEQQLLDNLSTENAANNLLLADVYNAKEMKSKVVDFIVEKSTKVTSTKMWRSIALANPQLIVEVCDALSRRLVDA